MNGERIEPNGIVTQMKALYSSDDGLVVSANRYRQDNERLQMRLGLLEWRMRMIEDASDNGIVGKASMFPWVPMSTTTTSFLTAVEYNTTTGLLSYTSRTARILGLGEPVSGTIALAEDC